MESSLPPPSQTLIDAIARSAASYDDLHGLRFSLGLLGSFEDPRARFARSLFELSLARRGEEEARGNLTSIADELLISWRDGNGNEFARLAPVLEDLWTEAATLMVSFEVHRFTQALELCANARGDTERLAAAIEQLLPEGNRAVEFARCLYHLELARLGVESSRAQFARRAGLLAEAYQSVDAAKQLIGNDEGLAQLWADVLPYLDEFFEMMEEEAARRERPSAPVRPSAPRATAPAAAAPEPTAPAIEIPAPVVEVAPPVPVAEELPPSLDVDLTPTAVQSVIRTEETTVPVPPPAPSQPEPAATVPEYAPVAPPPPIEETPTLPKIVSGAAGRRPAPPMLAPPVLEPVALGEGGDVPSFRTLLKKATEKEAAAREQDTTTLPPRAAPPPEPISEENLVEAVEEAPELALDDEDIVEMPGLPPSAPPPPPITAERLALVPPRPPPSTLVPPPPPPMHAGKVATSALDAVVEEDYVADAATLEFWRHTFTELELVPAENQPRSPERKLSADSRVERKRLTQYLDSLGPHIEVPEARAFSCLVRLLAAGQLKEKTLFGGVNARRAEAFADAFSFLSKNPMSAAHAAEFFVLDGLDTEKALRRGLDVLTDYVFWCGANGKDPLDFDAQNDFADRAKKK